MRRASPVVHANSAMQILVTVDRQWHPNGSLGMIPATRGGAFPCWSDSVALPFPKQLQVVIEAPVRSTHVDTNPALSCSALS